MDRGCGLQKHLAGLGQLREGAKNVEWCSFQGPYLIVSLRQFFFEFGINPVKFGQE